MSDFTSSKQGEAMRIDPNAPRPSGSKDEDDRSPGYLERAMNRPAEEHGVQVNRSDEGVQRTSIAGDGTVTHEHLHPMRGSTADRPLGTDAVADIRSQDGTPQSVHSMDMDSIVTLHSGGEVRLLEAIESGLVVLTENGDLVAGREAPPLPKAQEKEPEVHEDLKAVALPDAIDEQALEALQTDTSPSTQIEAVAEFAKTGEISAELIGRAASEAGVPASEMNSRLAAVQTSMFNQASARVAQHGIDPGELWAHANEHQREALGRAVHSQLTKRTLHEYDNLARDYILTMDEHSPDAILNGTLGDGIKGVHRDEKGVIVLTDTNGRTYSWKSAVRAGLVKLSR